MTGPLAASVIGCNSTWLRIGDNGVEYVITAAQMQWRTLEKPGFPADGFQFTDNVIGDDYTSAYSVRPSKIGPGGRSKLHREGVNHVIYEPPTVTGRANVQSLDG